MSSKSQEQWGSNFGFLMAVIASAVGLGSIWRFPYMVGSNGGGAFILAYAIIMMVVGILGMAVEIAMGRSAGKDAIESFTKIAPRSKPLGYIFILTGFLLMSIYSVLGGWALYYFFQSITFKVTTLSDDHFQLFQTSYAPIFWQMLFILLSSMILVGGISKGIERHSTWMNIALLVMIIIVVIRSLTLPGAMQGVMYLVRPDFSELANSHVWLMAIGQAFFSLSIGSGAIMTYGCYVDKKSNILQSGLVAGFTTLGMALLMGFAIFPAVFAMGQDPAGGPGLLFNVLPKVFAQIPGGSLLAILFFAATFFAALTSAISMVEPLISRVIVVSGKKRTTVTWIITAVLILVGLPMSLSFQLFANIKLFGMTIFDSVDFLLDKVLMPFNAFVILIMAGWLWKNKGLIHELSNDGAIKLPFPKLLLWMVRVGLPVLIMVIVLKPLVDYLLG